MAKTTAELNELFAVHPATELQPDVLGELQSILRLHSISPEDLSYKWQHYSMKMGSEQTNLDLITARAFKRDLQEMLERESRGKAHVRSVDKRGAFATPRAGKGDDMFGMLDGFVPNTPSQRPSTGASKRKAAFQTPSIPKTARTKGMSSPSDARPAANGDSNGMLSVVFADRADPGQVIQSFNEQLEPFELPIAPPAEPRIRLTAATDLRKFGYKPMAMHLSEASEVLDDRIDEFQLLVQEHHQLEDSAFGNASSQSTDETIAVGRIASDTMEGKLNAASLLIETSRRTGAGLRVPLKVDSISHEFFPGQIVALKGINASGEYFAVNEVLEIPLLPPSSSLPSVLDQHNERLGVEEEGDTSNPSCALNVMLASGPYTADDNLSFEPLHALCEKAAETYADMLVLVGPIFDIEHPLLASGDFDLPDDATFEPDKATLTDAFRILVGTPLRQLAQKVPSITITLIPSTRDAINKHVSWPQEHFTGRKELGLPKQAKLVTNPVNITLNEIVVGVSAHDVLYDLRREELVVGRPKENNIMARLPGHLIQQRHFYPLYPPVDRNVLPKTGTAEGIASGLPLDISYLKLGEWFNCLPDMLVTPSALAPFIKVVNGVVIVNPGPLSKRKGAGTYSQMSIYPKKVTDQEREREERVGHELYNRARIDIVKI